MSQKPLNPFVEVLKRLSVELEHLPINWVVTGSLGMALQGVPVAVHDVDIQTDKKGAYAIEQRLKEYVVNPVRFSETTRIRSHFGLLEIDSIEIEIMGDVQKSLDNFLWEEPVQIEPHIRWVELDGLAIPVMSLEYEYQAYMILGRLDKAMILRAWLRDTC